MNEQQKEVCARLNANGYRTEPDGNGNILVSTTNTVDWESAPNWADFFGHDADGKLAWFSKFGFKYVDDPWYRSFTELKTWPKHSFEAIETRPKPKDRIRERDVIVVGSGPSRFGGFYEEYKSRPRIGVGIGGLGGIGIKFAALALAHSISVGAVAESPQHDYLYESKPKTKAVSTRKHLSAGERKHRNKKLKSQRNSRRYNRKG